MYSAEKYTYIENMFTRALAVAMFTLMCLAMTASARPTASLQRKAHADGPQVLPASVIDRMPPVSDVAATAIKTLLEASRDPATLNAFQIPDGDQYQAHWMTVFAIKILVHPEMLTNRITRASAATVFGEKDVAAIEHISSALQASQATKQAQELLKALGNLNSRCPHVDQRTIEFNLNQMALSINRTFQARLLEKQNAPAAHTIADNRMTAHEPAEKQQYPSLVAVPMPHLPLTTIVPKPRVLDNHPLPLGLHSIPPTSTLLNIPTTPNEQLGHGSPVTQAVPALELIAPRPIPQDPKAVVMERPTDMHDAMGDGGSQRPSTSYSSTRQPDGTSNALPFYADARVLRAIASIKGLLSPSQWAFLPAETIGAIIGMALVWLLGLFTRARGSERLSPLYGLAASTIVVAALMLISRLISAHPNYLG